MKPITKYINEQQIVDLLLSYLALEIKILGFVSEDYVPKTFTIMCDTKSFDEIFKRLYKSEINGFEFSIAEFRVSLYPEAKRENVYITVDVNGNIYVNDLYSYDYCDNNTLLFIHPSAINPESVWDNKTYIFA